MQTNITPLYRSRQRSNLIGLVLSMSAMALGLIALVWILFVLFSNGFAALELSPVSYTHLTLPTSDLV